MTDPEVKVPQLYSASAGWDKMKEAWTQILTLRVQVERQRGELDLSEQSLRRAELVFDGLREQMLTFVPEIATGFIVEPSQTVVVGADGAVHVVEIEPKKES